MAGNLRKQGVGINAIVQQNQEFSIQNEDFPALPGYKGVNQHVLSCLLTFVRVLGNLVVIRVITPADSILDILHTQKVVVGEPKNTYLYSHKLEADRSPAVNC